MPIINPQGNLFDDPTTIAETGALIPSCVVGQQSWWTGTPTPFNPSDINEETGRPNSGSRLSLSIGPAKISWKPDLAEYSAEGDLYPREVYVIKEAFSISAQLLSLGGSAGSNLFSILSGGRIQSGVVGGVSGGTLTRYPITIIARNLNPKATGLRLFVVSIYSSYTDGIDFEIVKNDLSKVSVNFKAALPNIAPGYGIGRIFTL